LIKLIQQQNLYEKSHSRIKTLPDHYSIVEKLENLSGVDA